MSDITPFQGFRTPDGKVHTTEADARAHLNRETYVKAATAYADARSIPPEGPNRTRVINVIVDYLAYEEALGE